MIEYNNFTEAHFDNIITSYKGNNNNSKNCLVIVFEEENLYDIAKVYSDFFNYETLNINKSDTVLRSINKKFESYIVISRTERLDFNFLNKIVEKVLVSGSTIGFYVGKTRKDIQYQMYKSLYYLYKNNNIPYLSLIVEPIRNDLDESNLRKYSIYSKKLDKEIITKKYQHLCIYGGGRIDKLSLGKKYVLADIQTDPSKITITPQELNATVLIVNGCVLGVVNPDEYEKKGKGILSQSILKSKVISFIAPYSTKLSNENELEVTQAFLERGFSYGEVVSLLNAYCVQNNLTPAYILYGDPNLCSVEVEKKNYCMKQSDKITGTYPLSDKEILYFIDFGNKYHYLSKEKFDINDIEYVKFNLKQFLNFKKNTIENLRRDTQIAGMYPSDNDFKKMKNRLLDLDRSIEKKLVFFDTSTNINKKIYNSTVEFANVLNSLNIALLDYWKNNIEKDKKRMYDLHFGLKKRSIYSRDNICQACKEKTISQYNVTDFNDKNGRLVSVCPACSVVDDMSFYKLSVSILDYRKVNDLYTIEYLISNDSYEQYDFLITPTVRGNIIILNEPNVMISLNGQGKKRLSVSFFTEKETDSDSKLYFTLLICACGAINLYKRPLSINK